METEPRLLRVPHVAQQLAMSRSAIYQLMDSGRLAYVKIGRSRRIPVEAVDALVRSGTVGTVRNG